MLLVLAVAGFAAVFLSVDLAGAFDSDADSEENLNLPNTEPSPFSFERKPPHELKEREPRQDKAGMQPMMAIPTEMQMGPRGIPMGGPDDFGSRFEPEVPGSISQQPEYMHDADSETLSAHIRPMIDGDISEFDPGFVEDAIDYAMDNGMEDVAELLMKKLASYFESYMHTSLLICAMDTRASGIDDDCDEEADFELVDAEEEDPADPMPFSEPTRKIFESFSDFTEPRFVLLEL